MERVREKGKTTRRSEAKKMVERRTMEVKRRKAAKETRVTLKW